jgi:hypothetical protein
MFSDPDGALLHAALGRNSGPERWRPCSPSPSAISARSTQREAPEALDVASPRRLCQAATTEKAYELKFGDNRSRMVVDPFFDVGGAWKSSILENDLTLQ